MPVGLLAFGVTLSPIHLLHNGQAFSSKISNKSHQIKSIKSRYSLSRNLSVAPLLLGSCPNFSYYSACQQGLLLHFKVCSGMMSHSYFTYFIDSPRMIG